MKTKILVCLVFAALGLVIQGCGPETKITGRVLENRTGTPISDAAVLAMIWVEETANAQPVPVVEELEPNARDGAYDADMKTRGLPAAYARAFSDKVDAATETVKSKRRIAEVFENGHKLIRFYDNDGKKKKDINLDQKETKIRISKDKAFDASQYKIKISAEVMEAIKESRKRDNRDVELFRREFRETSFSGNNKFVAVEDGYLDFMEFADASDGELSETPVETDRVTTVYDSDGNKILELNKNDGWQPIGSNAGQFFIVTIGEYGKYRIMNRKKEILAEIPYFSGGAFFSERERFIIFEEMTYGSDKSSLSVFDTQNNKFELEKIVVSNLVFKNVEKMEILEDKREIIILHTQFHVRVAKGNETDRVRF